MRARIATLLVAALGAGALGSAGLTATPARAAVVKTYGQLSGITPPNNACGVNDPAAVNLAMARAATLGAAIVRCDLSWWIVQPTATTWNWFPYDNAVKAAAANGLQILFTPQFTPPWASPNPLPPGSVVSHVPPVNLTDYVTFVQEAVKRYAPNGSKRPPGLVGAVTMWEIWNEPNIPGFWNPVDPARYATMLKTTAKAIHALHRNAKVISAGLAPAANVSGNVAPDTFLDVIATAGALTGVQGVGIHPYTFPAFPSEQISWNPMVGIVPRMHTVLQNHGMGGKKIWATEVGWPTSSLSTQTQRFWDNNTQVGTEYWQSWGLLDLYKTWYQFGYAGPLVLYAFRDKCVDLTSWWCSMGIERFDGSRKPAFAVVQNILTKPVGSL